VKKALCFFCATKAHAYETLGYDAQGVSGDLANGHIKEKDGHMMCTQNNLTEQIPTDTTDDGNSVT